MLSTLGVIYVRDSEFALLTVWLDAEGSDAAGFVWLIVSAMMHTSAMAVIAIRIIAGGLGVVRSSVAWLLMLLEICGIVWSLVSLIAMHKLPAEVDSVIMAGCIVVFAVTYAGYLKMDESVDEIEVEVEMYAMIAKLFAKRRETV